MDSSVEDSESIDSKVYFFLKIRIFYIEVLDLVIFYVTTVLKTLHVLLCANS